MLNIEFPTRRNILGTRCLPMVLCIITTRKYALPVSKTIKRENRSPNCSNGTRKMRGGENGFASSRHNLFLASCFLLSSLITFPHPHSTFVPPHPTFNILHPPETWRSISPATQCKTARSTQPNDPKSLSLERVWQDLHSPCSSRKPTSPMKSLSVQRRANPSVITTSIFFYFVSICDLQCPTDEDTI